MLETAIAVAAITGAYSLAAAVLATVVNHHRTKLEKRRIEHETQQWLLELHSHFEKQLHSVRLEEYPPIFAELERLSHFRIEDADEDSIAELVGKLNAWGYGRSGLVMSGPTRDALFKLRYKLGTFAAGPASVQESLLAGARTDFTEWLRRDMNHSDSSWRQFPSLLKKIVEATRENDPLTAARQHPTDADVCRSLLHAIAGNPCPVPWNAVAVPPAGLLLLWDDQEEASSLILDAVASQAGQLVASCCIECGPHGRPMIGATVRSEDASNLDADAATLRTRYAIAITPAGGDPADGPF